MSIWSDKKRKRAYLDACVRASYELDRINTDRNYTQVVNAKGRERYEENAKLFEGCKSVIEIGGGYGGQCLASGVEDYTIVDLPEVLQLIESFLEKNGRTADLIPPGLLFLLEAKEFDFMISDFALSELDDEIQWDYLSISAKHGRITGEAGDIDRLASKFGIPHKVSVLDPEARIINKVIEW